MSCSPCTQQVAGAAGAPQFKMVLNQLVEFPAAVCMCHRRCQQYAAF
jgi:hypothetical protein